MWCLGGFARCLAHWGGILGWEILYLGVERLVTPIWDVLAPQGEQERALKHLSMRSRSPAFQIGQVVPVGIAWARFYSWARWARFCTVKILSYGRYSVFTYNVLFYKFLGTR
jgi:hypothetical protein